MVGGMSAVSPGVGRNHEYLLKFLLVGDSDVGKNDILDLLHEDDTGDQLCNHHAVVTPKTTFILLEGKLVKLQLWDTSGQGRFSTIIRSYSRGAQGILVVYDITNRWSFDGISRWLKEIDEQAPGIPKILIGNRLHLEFRRQVSREDAENYADKRGMEYFEVSTLAYFNILESLTELSRLVLTRNGMERLWKNNRVLSLQESCCRSIVRQLSTVHDIDRLPLPYSLHLQLRSFADSNQLTSAHCTLPRTGKGLHRRSRSDMSMGSPCGSLSAGALKRSMLAPFRKFSEVRGRRTGLSASLSTTSGITSSNMDRPLPQNGTDPGSSTPCMNLGPRFRRRTERHPSQILESQDDSRQNCALM